MKCVACGAEAVRFFTKMRQSRLGVQVEPDPSLLAACDSHSNMFREMDK
jgi:hypothetical protein